MRGSDSRNGPPVFPLVVDDEILSGFAWNDFWQLPDALRVVMLFPEALMGVLRHQMHVLHQFLRFGEHGLVDALDDDLVFIEDVAVDGVLCVVDVVGAERFNADKVAFDIELLGDDC